MPDIAITYHEDAVLFRDALQFTAAETGFSQRLIEKDYYCSVALANLAAVEGVVFKGGTCLSKIHADFRRLSEDLDFAVSTPVAARRGERSKLIAPFKAHLAAIGDRMDVLRIVEPLRGYNNSTQYGLRLAYRSVVTGQDESVRIEVGIREPVVEVPLKLGARTLLIDPFRRGPAVRPFDVVVLTRREAYSEKLRAALSRRDPAIRDFFDVDHAISVGNIDIADDELIRLLRQKLLTRGNDPVDVSSKKLDHLRTQLQSQLELVLRDGDFSRFDLDRAFRRVADFASRL